MRIERSGIVSLATSLQRLHQHHHHHTKIMASPGGPPPMPMGPPGPGQQRMQPSPEQIAAMQRQLAIDAQKAGMSVPEFIQKLKADAIRNHQAQQAAAQQQQQHHQRQRQQQHNAQQPTAISRRRIQAQNASVENRCDVTNAGRFHPYVQRRTLSSRVTYVSFFSLLKVIIYSSVICRI